MNKHPYYGYYDRVIRQDTNGFKLVLGGTGLGKTSGIVDVVQYAETNGRRFIYCANRIQLLNEMAQKLQKRGIKHVHLRSDSEVVFEAIFEEGSDDFHALLYSSAIKNAKPSKKHRLTYPKLLETVNYVKEMRGELAAGPLLEKALQREVSDIVRFFQVVLADYHYHDVSVYRSLTANTAVQTLFPYIAFKSNPQAKLLLITIQKAFRGFFNGRSAINLNHLKEEDGNHIIFLDEFDFLESDLIDLLCDTRQIDQPFRFVEFFYNAMKYHKLPLQMYPINATARKRIEDIVEIVDRLRDEAHINFPTINQFTSSLPQRKAAIFQTNHTVTSSPLYLEQTERSFQIVDQAESEDSGNHLKAIRLFDAVHNASTRIVYLFKQLESESPVVYEEMRRHCFERTDFFWLVPLITQLPRPPRRQYTRFDNLLDSGYGLYEIHDLQQETDAQEVTFRHYSIYTTPEKILHNLTANNLVFGLSATADIPRHVRNFSIDWLKKQTDVVYYEVDKDDIAIIQQLNEQKQSARGNSVKVMRAKKLDKQDRLMKFIKAVADDEEFGGDDSPGYRRRRVENFFAALQWIVENHSPEEIRTDTNLFFFNTFSQIKYLFERHPQPEQRYYSVRKRKYQDQLFVAYDLVYQGQEFIVVFYDASQARLIQSSEAAKRQYHQLFWEEKPVALVTQYPSAGNGVNLQYLPTPQSSSNEEIDFKNIHLLESPYFFFGQVQAETDSGKHNATLKKNLWYLAKLFEGKIVSDAWFRSVLNNIRKPTLNDDYHKGIGPIADDARLNRIASFVQALGRIERVWRSITDQVILLASDAYNDFQMFCTHPQYEYIREKRQPILSNNLQQVLEQIKAQTIVDERLMRRKKEERLRNVQERCRQAIERLVEQLEDVRTGKDNGEIKDKWEMLRKVVLRHDFNADILRDYDCVFTTPYYEDGCLFINRKCEIFPQNIEHSDIYRWRLDAVYHLIAENTVVRRYFQDRGYELAFGTVSGRFFTPYCYQSILVGAIGEEVTKAILLAEKVPLEEVSNSLYELVDLKIAGCAWFVDCKNYNERTLDQFRLSPDDPAYRFKLNEEDFRQLAQHKLNRIRRSYSDAKLMFINLASRDNRPFQYFTDKFLPANNFNEADIIIIQGALNKENPDCYNKPFERFLNHLKNQLEGEL
jgi:hypothetical protein